VRCRRDALPLIQTGANVHDSEQSIPLIDAIPPIQRLGGGRRRRPDQAFANRVYDAEPKIGYEQSIPLIDAIPPIQRLGGGRRRRPDQAFANRAYDAEPKIGYPCDNTISSGLGQHLSS